MIFVTGATGNVGSEVVKALLETGEAVRALVRSPDATASLPAGAESFVGDLNNPESLAGGFAGARGVYLLAGYNDMPSFLAHARDAGVEHVVLQSSSAVPLGDTSNAVAAYHIEAEAAVRDSSLAWTFLQPNTFMTNTFQWLAQLSEGDVVQAQFADIPVATVDPFDIAAVAVAAFNSPEHRGRSYHLTGPESLLPADRLRILGEALGRPLRLVALTNDQARAEMSKAMPPKYVDAFMSMWADGNHDETRVLPAVQDVTGRPPRRFEQWVASHLDRFR
jgi:uncharacterized protein YbjT (DUF2867 family)